MGPVTINGVVVYFSFDPNGDVIYVNIPPINGVYIGSVTFPVYAQITNIIGAVGNIISILQGLVFGGGSNSLKAAA